VESAYREPSPRADGKSFTTGSGASRSTSARYSAASTATFIVLAAPYATSGCRAEFADPPGGPIQ